jgi:hypothetical protein
MTHLYYVSIFPSHRFVISVGVIYISVSVSLRSFLFLMGGVGFVVKSRCILAFFNTVPPSLQHNTTTTAISLQLTSRSSNILTSFALVCFNYAFPVNRQFTDVVPVTHIFIV